MRVLVTGGDGFCGWPTSLHLSAAGHDVTILDNLIRRRWDRELGTEPLIPLPALGDRIDALTLAHRDRIRPQTMAPTVDWRTGEAPAALEPVALA